MNHTKRDQASMLRIRGNMKFSYRENSNNAGIYKIINTHTNRIYIGQTNKFKKRWHDHKRQLINGKHQNKFLLNDFKKCLAEIGNDDFLEFYVVEVLIDSTKEERNLREEFWIKEYFDKQELCYNFKEKAASKERTCFSKNPIETKKILSEKAKQMWENKEKRKEITEKIKKHHNTEESKNNLSNNAKKLWESLEHKQLISNKMKEIHKNKSNEEKNY